jgi:hypothetical protein
MPTRYSMRRSSDRPALRVAGPPWTSIAQRTASTTLRNSTMLPSPVRLTMRPWWSAMVASMRSLRSAPRCAPRPREPTVSDDIGN